MPQSTPVVGQTALGKRPTEVITNSDKSPTSNDTSSGRNENQAETSVSNASSPISLPRRRNGKPQSCEPCRKAKSACDHTLPKCQKCIRRGIASQCKYHPSPMTRTNGAHGSGISKLRDRERFGGRSPNSVNVAANNLLLLLSQQRTSPNEGPSPDTDDVYLGPTSYDAVFREDMGSFDPDILSNDNEEPAEPDNSDRPELRPQNLQQCVDAFLCFPDEELSEKLLERYFSYCDVALHEPSAWYCLRSLWSTWGSDLKSKDRLRLKNMAESVITAPRIILRTCRSSAEWLESFTGKHLRIEMIGNFLAAFGLAAMTIPEWDPFFTAPKDGLPITKKQYVFKVGTGSETCTKLCTMKAISSEPLVWLLHHSQLLQSQYSGDENGYLWRKAGHVATAVTSLGLHREDATAPRSAPFMVAELRKRTFGAVFIADKQLATFTGRPPRLSRRYSHCQLPLDLSDDQLMSEGEELQKHLAQLDAAGWNQGAKARYVTLERGFMLMSLLRDEVLEVCLGPSAEVSPARREELKQRCEDTYAHLPPGIRFDITTPICATEHMLCGQVLLRLEFLLHIFLLERLPTTADDTHSNKQNLINISKTIIEHVIVLARYRDRLADFSYGMTWAVVYFGLPSAGILTLELLKQHQYPRQYALSLSRSEIVQILSVFLFCLSMVGPDEGNFKICVRMKKVISRSLDRVLEPRDAELEEMITPGGSRQPLPDVDMPSMMGVDDDPDFMEWLTSVDWEKGPWADTF